MNVYQIIYFSLQLMALYAAPIRNDVKTKNNKNIITSNNNVQKLFTTHIPNLQYLKKSYCGTEKLKTIFDTKNLRRKRNAIDTIQGDVDLQLSPLPKRVVYKLQNTFDDSRAPLEQLRVALDQSMTLWANVLPIDFVPEEMIDERRHNDFFVNITFFKGAHGDERPFDGAGGEYGHAFMPKSVHENFPPGTIHLDMDEKWSINDELWQESAFDNGVQLSFTIVHETGHVLGLLHTKTTIEDFKSQIMQQNQRRIIPLKLGIDDINRAQYLYGERKNEYKQIQRKSDKSASSICDGHFDAITDFGFLPTDYPNLLIFKNDLFYSIDIKEDGWHLTGNKNGTLLTKSRIGRMAARIDEYTYGNLAGPISAVDVNAFGYMRIFKGRATFECDVASANIQKFNSAQLQFGENMCNTVMYDNRQKPAIEHIEDIDAVLTLSGVFSSYVDSYYFSGKLGAYWYYKDGVRRELFKLAEINPAIKKVDAAMAFNDVEVYLFVGDRVYKTSIAKDATLMPTHKFQTIRSLFANGECEEDRL